MRRRSGQTWMDQTRSVSSSHDSKVSDERYLLTDPALQSLSQEFGSMDGGLQSMKDFFSRHRCSHLCQADWGRAAPVGAAAVHPARMGSSFFFNVRR
mmetsp:Transcript_52484/g.150458  ORF Transcript_52484/g.150458 Transcript_52484/m.150458 type:complete len:97 (+) Transcript_52484:470-760(+)